MTSIQHIGIVGTGLMGRGIAQIAAQGGFRVSLYDARPEGAAEALAFLGQTWSGLQVKGKLTPEQSQTALARVSAAPDLTSLADCDLVLEAIVEKLEAKRSLFQALEAVVRPDCILASNTSSLSITAIAAACTRPQRVAGLHFFSPVPLIKVVEVVEGVLTQAEVLAELAAVTRAMGHQPVQARDTPGFIVNHASRGYLTESLRILSEGITSPEELDAILRDGAGFRMGPCELLDLTGLDVSLPVMEAIYDQYYQEPRYRPAPLLRQRLAAGLLGRKSGRGFYTYAYGRKVEPALTLEGAPAVEGELPPVWLDPSKAEAAAAAAIRARLASQGIPLEDGPRPSDAALCLVLPLGTDATTACLAAGLDPRRTLALDALAREARWVLMSTPVTSEAMKAAARARLGSGGTPVSLIHDSPGLVVQRVLAAIVNVGCDIAQQRIASPEDIDRAVTLALGYPKGPLAWGDALGPGRVLTLLEGLYDFYRDPRYRPSPWLKRRALLGVSLLTPEA